MRGNVVVPLRVCIECHGQIRSAEPYIYIPAKRHSQPAFRHADCDEVCGALGVHLPSPPPLGGMLDSWELLRAVVPRGAWEATESLQSLQRSMVVILERMDAEHSRR